MCISIAGMDTSVCGEFVRHLADIGAPGYFQAPLSTADRASEWMNAFVKKTGMSAVKSEATIDTVSSRITVLRECGSVNIRVEFDGKNDVAVSFEVPGHVILFVPVHEPTTDGIALHGALEFARRFK
jgi:hypothetical protein